MTERELPAEVEEQLLARCNGGNGRRRARRHVASEQRGGTAPGEAGEQGTGGDSQSGREQVTTRDARHKNLNGL